MWNKVNFIVHFVPFVVPLFCSTQKYNAYALLRSNAQIFIFFHFCCSLCSTMPINGLNKGFEGGTKIG